MPDGTRQLPVSCRKHEIHAEMLLELAAEQNVPIVSKPSLSTFNAVWDRVYPDVVLPKYSKLGKCLSCCFINQKLRTSKPSERGPLLRMKREHRVICRMQRNSYFNRIRLSERNPRDYTSVCADFTNTIPVPYSAERPKDWLRKHRLAFLTQGTADQ